MSIGSSITNSIKKLYHSLPQQHSQGVNSPEKAPKQIAQKVLFDPSSTSTTQSNSTTSKKRKFFDLKADAFPSELESNKQKRIKVDGTACRESGSSEPSLNLSLSVENPAAFEKPSPEEQWDFFTVKDKKKSTHPAGNDKRTTRLKQESDSERKILHAERKKRFGSLSENDDLSEPVRDFKSTPIRSTKPSLTKSTKMHFLPMQGAIYMEMIMSGQKKFEGRICRAVCDKLAIGHQLKFFDRKANWGIICDITSLDRYKSFKAMLLDKGVLPMLPQLKDQSTQLNHDELVKAGVAIYERFPGAQGVHQLGVMAIGVDFVKKIHSKEQS